jgi:hypothetical protein
MTARVSAEAATAAPRPLTKKDKYHIVVAGIAEMKAQYGHICFMRSGSTEPLSAHLPQTIL